MRALIAIVVLGVVGSLGCAATPKAPEQQEASQTNLLGWGKSSKSIGASDSKSSSASKESDESGGASSPVGDRDNVDDYAPDDEPVDNQVPASGSKGAGGGYGDFCDYDGQCASNVCKTDGSGTGYCTQQ